MVIVGVCSSSGRESIRAFQSQLRSEQEVVVKFIELPYNNLDAYRLKRDCADKVILCHSIHNRRFAITDVVDSLYDKFLNHAKGTFGKENVAVIAHDFPQPESGDGEARKRLTKVRMASFHIKQPTTFQCTDLALTCGKLDTVVDIDNGDWLQVKRFLTRSRQTGGDLSSSSTVIIQIYKDNIALASYPPDNL
ncbi:uncharacterized protein [Diadema antillarum]|uniref:uncharacterized protein n=1 Tax=Diadema antillarum TaxID=105358 RepID=UPI003A84EDC3